MKHRVDGDRGRTIIGEVPEHTASIAIEECLVVGREGVAHEGLEVAQLLRGETIDGLTGRRANS
jgi:hypothetical protein